MASCCQVVPLATRPKNGIKASLRKDQYLHHKYDTQSPFAPRKKRLHGGQAEPNLKKATFHSANRSSNRYSASQYLKCQFKKLPFLQSQTLRETPPWVTLLSRSERRL